MKFALKLRDALVNAEWSKLRPYRDPTIIEYDDWGSGYRGGQGWTSRNKHQGSTYVSRFDSDYAYGATYDDNFDELNSKLTTMEKVVEEFPYEIAEILSEYGYNKEGLIRDILHFHKSWMYS